ncbi:MAG: dihydroneopterin aldolase [Proteobacteria bacterium]|nr:dihydroneopterin aldolase [Pseudomonadota bacterium]
MDRIFLRELKAEAIIGIFDWERQVRQTVLIDLEMAVDVRRAAATDSIEDTLNYKRVAKRVKEFIDQSAFHLVETLAEQIARVVIDEFHVPWVKVTLNKPGAIRGSKSVGIIIERTGAEAM